MMQRKQGKPINLIYQHPQDSSKLCLNNEAIALIQNYNTPFCFLTICGDYRTGKSFLLNSLFFSGGGFQISSTTESCTKGIKMWTQPIYYNNTNMWVIDTEGFGSLEKDAAYDGKIFLLSVLLSNIVLYNSLGAIDQNSIERFSIICRETNQILDNSVNTTALFWILRDFSLEIKDRNGHAITSNQYLQQALSTELHSHNDTLFKEQRNIIKKVFSERHCVPLIRPVIEECKLYDLKSVELKDLRSEFVEEIYKLRKRVMSCIHPKIINGVIVSTQNLSIILQEYIHIINQDISTDLLCTYQKIIAFQKEKVSIAILQIVAEKIQKIVHSNTHPFSVHKMLELEAQLLSEVEKNIKKQQILDQEKFQEKYIADLKQQIQFQYFNVLKQNNQMKIKSEIQKYFQETFNTFLNKISKKNGVNLSFLENFECKYEDLIKSLKQNYAIRFSQFLSNYEDYFIIFLSKQEKTMFLKIFSKIYTEYRQVQQKIVILKKQKFIYEEEIRKNKEENVQFIKIIEESKKEADKNIDRIIQKLELDYRNKYSENQLKMSQKVNREKKILQNQNALFKKSLEEMFNQKNNLIKSSILEKEDLSLNLEREKQKSELFVLKYQQIKNSQESLLEQTRSQLQNRIKILEIKCNESQSFLSNERKKYCQLNEQKKLQEFEMLEDIAQKNEKILELRRSISQLQQHYRTEIEKILIQEKQIISKSIQEKIQQYQRKNHVYEKKIQQYMQIIKEIEPYQRLFEELTLEFRSSQYHLELQQDQVKDLKHTIQKNQALLQEKDSNLQIIKGKLEKQIEELKENIANCKRFMMEQEKRYEHEIQHLKSKCEYDLKGNLSEERERHAEDVNLMKAKYQEEKGQEIGELARKMHEISIELQRQQISANLLKNQFKKYYFQLAKIHQTYSHVKNYQNQSSNNSQYLSFQIKSSVHSFDLTEESPEEEMIQKMKQSEEIIQEIYESTLSIIKDFSMLREERIEIKKQLQENLINLEQCEGHISKVNQQNMKMKSQIEEMKRIYCRQQLESTKTHQERYYLLNKEFQKITQDQQLYKEIYQKRQFSIKENLDLYKQTINNLSEENTILQQENYHLKSNMHLLQEEIKRFNQWGDQIQENIQNHQNQNQISKQSNQQQNQIKQLEFQIKKLTKKLQEEKISSSTSLQQRSAIKKQANNSILANILNENKLIELESIKKENTHLKKAVEDYREKQLKSYEQKKTYRNKLLELQENKYNLLKAEHESYKKRTKQQLSQLENKIFEMQDERNNLKRQFIELKQTSNCKIIMNQKLLLEEVELLKKQKNLFIDSSNKKILASQEHMSFMKNQCDRRIAEEQQKQKQKQLQFLNEKRYLQEQLQKLNKMYEQSAKENEVLLSEVESWKSKTNQLIVKQKYRQKISNLFSD